MGTSYQKKRLKPLTTKRTFEKIKYNPNNKCIFCKKIVDVNFMICRNSRLCRECYTKKMEQQKNVSIKFLSISKQEFEGNEILDNILQSEYAVVGIDIEAAVEMSRFGLLCLIQVI